MKLWRPSTRVNRHIHKLFEEAPFAEEVYAPWLKDTAVAIARIQAIQSERNRVLKEQRDYTAVSIGFRC